MVDIARAALAKLRQRVAAETSRNIVERIFRGSLDLVPAGALVSPQKPPKHKIAGAKSRSTMTTKLMAVM